MSQSDPKETLTKPRQPSLCRNVSASASLAGFQVPCNQRLQSRLGKLPVKMSRRWMCDAREPALGYQVFVCLRPGWDRIAGRDPVGVRRFVTPFDKARHNFGVRRSAAKRLHGCLAFPHGQSPEGAMSVQKQSSTEKPRCAQNLALTKKCLPHECRKILDGANSKTRDRRKHELSFYADCRRCNQVTL
jgi:hypothetical protein